MSPEDLGLTTAEVALETFCQLVCTAGVLYFALLTTFGWFLSSFVVIVLTILLLAAGLSAIVYFRKPKASNDQFARFMSPAGSGVIGHRGAAADAPENTIAAIQEAKKNSAVGVEVDVELTKDGVAVLMHDATVDRTTDGTGFIGELCWQDVQQLNAAAKFSSSQRSHFSYESVPTLEEAVRECLDLKLRIFFDVKAYSEQMVEELVKLYKKYPDLYDTAMVCSFYPTTVYRVRQLDSGILTALTSEPYFLCGLVMKRLKGSPSWWKLLPFAFLDKLLVWAIYSWLWFLCGNSAVLLDKDTISRNVISYWTNRGMEVIPWTVNKKIEKDFFSQHGCHYITDSVK